MSFGLAALYKIIKDENRQQIIKLLNEKGSASYTELLEASDIGSTGLLNYHLKVLSDLIIKNETGEYLLTDKGKIALSVLHNFPAEATMAQKKKSQKIFWSILAVGQVVILTSVLIYYFLGVVDTATLTQVSISFVMGIFLAFFGYRMMTTAPVAGSDKMKQRMRIAYPLGGATIALIIAFFVVPLFLAVFFRPLLRYYLTDWNFILVITVPPALGAYWGYWVGKRNGFNKPKWMTWIDEKTGFA